MMAVGLLESYKAEENKLQGVALGAASAVVGAVGVGANAYNSPADLANRQAQNAHGRDYDDLTRTER